MDQLHEDRFYMWRAVVAMMHADGVVTPHELSFINSHIDDLPLSEDQNKILHDDIQTAQDPYEMFAHINNVNDKRDFFALARALSWCDGDFDKQERLIIETLEKSHMDEETMAVLQETRDIIQEVELCEDQWNFKSERSRNLFGFLNKKKAA